MRHAMEYPQWTSRSRTSRNLRGVAYAAAVFFALCFIISPSIAVADIPGSPRPIDNTHKDDIAISAPLTSVEDVTEIPAPPPTPLPPPGQDLVDHALQILEDVQTSKTSFFSSSSTSSEPPASDDPLLRILGIIFDRIFGSLLPPQLLSSLPFNVGLKAESSGSGFENQVDESWRFDHVELADVESIWGMKREDGETASMRIARAARLLALAGYDLEHEKALLLLADMNMFRSYGQARNTTSAFKHYSHLAHQHGNPVGQRYVGLMYASGIGVKRDYAKALVYLNFAAMGQDVIAEQTLGYWYSTGIGVAKSCDDAVFFYRAAADKAINLYKSGPPFGLAMPPSKQRLPDEQGGIYGPGASGPGHQQAPQNSVSPETMKEIFEVQAEDDVAVQVHLGRAYYDGTPPFTRDFRKAMKYFKMAARAYTGVKLPAGAEVSGSLKTKMIYAGVGSGYLGLMHWRGDGVKQDNATARKLFERGEELDNGMSLAALGMMHLDGSAGFKKDPKKALEYFTVAAQGENHEAQVQLGEANLRSSKPDAYLTAFKFYSAAARNPAHIMALYRLGEMYSKGIGTSANCLLGVGYLKSVSEKGDWHDDTIRKAESLYRRGDRESALLHYLLAGERGIEVAQSNAAWMVDRGLVPPAAIDRVFGRENVDPYEVAIVLWNRAANQGNVDGRVKVGDYYFHGLGVNAVAKRRNGTESGSVSTGGDKSATGAEHLVDGAPEAKLLSDQPAEPVKKTQVYEKTTSILGVIREWMAETSLLPGGAPGKPDYRMAAMYYQVASDEHSALAQWNLGYMHENGLGVEKDFPLAKRMYDMALSTNMDAYLPVNLALIQLFIKSTAAFLSKLVADLVTGRLFRTILDKVVSLSVALLQTELGALAGDHVHDILPILGDEDEAGDAAAGVAGDLFDMTGPYAPLVKNLMKAWSGVWFELVLVSGLAALASVLFLWRQLISAADDAARRAAAVAAAAAADEAARRAAAAARPAPVPAPAPTAAVPTPSVPPTATTASAVGSEKNGADPVETESIGDSEMRHRTNTKAEGEA